MPGFDPLWTLHKYMAALGVEPQMDFIDALLGAKMVPYEGGGAYAEGSYGATQEMLGRYPGLKSGGDYPTPGTIEASPGEGKIFLHEALHRLDDVLSDDTYWRAINIALGHYAEDNPTREDWLRRTLTDQNPEMPAHEAFPRLMLDFLQDPENWPEEMSKLFGDYFKFVGGGAYTYS